MQRFEFEQYSSDWWKTRQGIPTASDFSSIVTPAKWEFAAAARGYAAQLVADTFDPYYGLRDNNATKEMWAGTLAEPEHRMFYESLRDLDVEQVGFCLTDDGRFGCSPDGLVGEDGGLEIKRPQPATQVKYLLDGGVPLDYLPQVHGSLIVTGRQWWDFLSLCPGLPPLLVRVEPDGKTEQLRGHLERFWEVYQDIKEQIEAKQAA